MTAVAEAVDRVTAVNAALAAVLDPELDRPITDLGFVRAVSVGADGSVEARLRLPTYFCAPNFAWLMVSVVCASESDCGALMAVSLA